MDALRWYGKQDVRVEKVPEPELINPHDAIIKITATAICGSDLHLYNGVMPTMQEGDILGHEFMGEVVELGPEAAKALNIGDKVVVPFTIACGECAPCKQARFSSCDTSNPNEKMAKAQMGQSPSGIFGYSHLLGGFSGGQAEYARVPFAHIGPLKVPQELPDEKVLFLSDILPTGYMAALNGNIQKGDTVAVWGCGPVGQFVMQCAWMLGAGRVIGIDCVSERLHMAESLSQAETINFKEENVFDALMAMTRGRGVPVCIDAVGCEAHAGSSIDAVVDKVKHMAYLTTDRIHVLREAILSCAKGGTISVPGVYVGFIDHLPFGAAMNKGLTIKMGQTHVQQFMKPLLDKIIEGKIDPSKIISHRLKLKDAAQAYQLFDEKKQGCTKIVLTP